MKRITGIAIVELAEGTRIAYTFSEIDENGNVISSNNKRSYVCLKDDVMSSISIIKKDAESHMNQ